ncbi:MAG: hypothetical protein LBT59_01970 [Clostridiales bacterium]|nr:hypothetical protein [Clostridiales bacterium]
MDEASRREIINCYASYVGAVSAICDETARVHDETDKAAISKHNSCLRAESLRVKLKSAKDDFLSEIDGLFDAVEKCLTIVIIGKYPSPDYVVDEKGDIVPFRKPVNSAEKAMRLKILQETLKKGGASEEVIAEMMERMKKEDK